MTNKTTERWCAIRCFKGYVFTGKYEVSNWGNLRNAETKTPLATYSNGKGQGYLKTKITDIEGKQSLIRSSACSLLFRRTASCRRNRSRSHRRKRQKQQLYKPALHNTRRQHPLIFPGKEGRMNEAEKEQRRMALVTCGGVCEVCGKTLTASTWQGAHRIANTKPNRAKWGSWIIDHPLNIAIVCSLACNQSCNIGNNPGKCLRLVQKIVEKELIKF